VTFFLFAAAFVGGALNAVAGGGSFIGLPALIFAGVPAASANATNTLALWPASISSAWAYRRELSAARGWVSSLGVVSLAGGVLGGLLLVGTSDAAFLRLLPWLLLVAAATFSFGSTLQRVFTQQPARATEHPAGAARRLPVLFCQFLIAIYGGYFGGGMGIMMLATFAIAGMTEIHEMNALKTLLGVAINGLALITFVVKGAIAWGPGLVMIAGAIVGGYFGATIARKTDPKWVRLLVTVIAWTMTTYFFIR